MASMIKTKKITKDYMQTKLFFLGMYSIISTTSFCTDQKLISQLQKQQKEHRIQLQKRKIAYYTRRPNSSRRVEILPALQELYEESTATWILHNCFCNSSCAAIIMEKMGLIKSIHE